MRSLVLLTLSFSLLSIVRGASFCVTTCIGITAPGCLGDVTCACKDRQFTNQLLSCVRGLCDDDDDIDEARAICNAAETTPGTTPPPTTTGPTGTTAPPTNTGTTPTNTNTVIQPSDTTPSNTPTDTQPPNATSTPATQTSTPTQTPTTRGTGTTTPRTATSTGTLPTAFVYPRDERITYTPADSWIDAGAESGCSNGARSSSSIGSAISFKFTGTAISFFTLPLSTSGNWSITIDNLPAQTISGSNAQNANVNGCNTFVSYQKQGLVNGEHTFTAKILSNGSVKRAASTMYFAALMYQGAGATDTPPIANSSSPNPAIIGGAVGGAVGAIALIFIAVWIIRTRRRRNKWKGGEIDLPDSPSEHDLVAKATFPPDTLRNEKSYGSTSGGYPDRQYGNGHASPYLDSPYGDSPYAAAAPGRAGVGSGYNRGQDEADSQAYGAWQQQQQQQHYQQQSPHGYSYPQQYAYGQYPAAAPSTAPTQYPPSSRAPTRQWSSHEAARGTPPPLPPAKAPPPLAPMGNGGDMRPAAGQRTPAPNEEDAYGGMEY